MGLKKDYYHKCATCTGYGLNNISMMKPGVGFYCHKKQDYFPLDDSCSSWLFGYQENSKVTDEDIEDAMKALKPKEGCFITTIVCELLGRSDDDSLLETMRSLRSYMSGAGYTPLLVQYDTVGPVIAQRLHDDVNGKVVANGLLAKYLNNCMFLVQNGQYDDAVSIYYEMVEYLASHYGVYIAIDTDFEQPNPPEALGHGVRVRKSGI